MAIDDALNRTPRKNSFGDAAAAMSNPNVTQVQATTATAPKPVQTTAQSAGAQMTALPSNQASAPISPTNIFPQGHPSAGRSPYASAPATVPSAEAQPDPVAAHNQKLAAAQRLQSLQQAPSASASPADSQAARKNYLELQQKSVAMQPSYFTQEGPTAAKNRAAAESAASNALQSMYVPQELAASNPYANVTPEQGRAMSEINAKAQMMDLSSAPTPYAPVQQPRSPAAIAMETTSDIKREGNSYSGTNVSGDFTINGQAPSSGGQVSAKKMSAAEAMMAPLHMSGDQGTSFQPAAPTSTPHSGNSWSAANALRNLEGAASSITNQPGRWSSFGGKNGQSPAAQAYSEAMKADIALRTGNDPMALGAQREQGATQREGMQQQGATARTQMQEAGATQRDAGRNAIQQGELGLKREAQGLQSRLATQQEQLRNTLIDPNATPEQRRIAQRNLEALNGKPDQWKAVALQGGTDAQGNKTDSVLGAVNERTGEMKRMETGQGGAAGNPPKVSTQSSFDALPKGAEYIGADGRKYMK